MSTGIDQISEEAYHQSPGATHASIIVERQGITALGGIEHGETSSMSDEQRVGRREFLKQTDKASGILQVIHSG
jgi:hypothetical protein